MRSVLPSFLLVLGVALPASAAAPVQSVEVLSEPYRVDKKYGSMMGPMSAQIVSLEQSPGPELLWIVGYEARMVGADGRSPMSQEFMCHSNLDLDMTHHAQIFGWQKRTANRLFTLSQGQFEIRFPEGFGIPMLSLEELELTTQVLNHNVEPADFRVRHKAGEDVFVSRARGPETGIGVDHVDHFSSGEGVALYSDHEYELVSVYENTSGEDRDSMAVMYLYVLDREYRRPALLFDPHKDKGGTS